MTPGGPRAPSPRAAPDRARGGPAVGESSYDGAMSAGAPPALGAHVEQVDPIAEARARRAPHVQFFLGDPQGYRGPDIRYAGGADGLRVDAEAAGVALYVHAPYIVNV